MPMKKKCYVTYYDVLGITPEADDRVVRAAYYEQARRWHPDRNPRTRQKSAQYFTRINRAYTCLRTKPQRQAYNRSLRKYIAEATPAANENMKNTHGFLPAIKEILWPFASAGEAHHG